MRRVARIFGLIWIAGVILAAIVLIGSGHLRGGRGVIYLLFGAVLPGVWLFRWGKDIGINRAKPIQPALKPKAPLDTAVDAGHVMQIEKDPPSGSTASDQARAPKVVRTG